MKDQSKNLSQRRSIRLSHYDYRQPGSYFITVCAYKRRCIFGKVNAEKVELTSIGKIVERCWQQIPVRFNSISLDEYVVMPNHFHGIINIDAAAHFERPEHFDAGPILPGSLASIVGGFKSAVTCRARRVIDNQAFLPWQRNYFEHVIRNETDLYEIQQYIVNNPLKWELDHLHPDRLMHPSGAFSGEACLAPTIERDLLRLNDFME